jgi:hypothetical protein
MVVRRLTLLAGVVVCLALSSPVWAGNLTFDGTSQGQGLMSFTPGAGDTLTIGSDGVNLGALVNELFLPIPQCAGGECAVTNGYLTMTSGAQTSVIIPGVEWGFGPGGSATIFGKIPALGINSVSALLSFSYSNGATFSVFGSGGIYAGTVNLSSIVLAPLLHLALGGVGFTGGDNDEIAFAISELCSSGVCKGDVTTADTSLQYITEPATLCGLGAGLLVFGTGLRRKILNS